MPPKRKVTAKKATYTKKGNKVPDRFTWPGWIEMESEPAFFNVMLKEMGVHGVKLNEVYSLENNDLVTLPQPVHALIFLFRYQATDKDKLETECPKQVWYAEQVPDFACATFALLNIVNNIPNLEMGEELRTFKESTLEMTPRLRGDAIDEFTFVKRIHNSFARDEDLLQADAHLKEKLAKVRKEQAVAKAKKTKAANAAARAAKAARVAKSSPSEETVAKAARAPRSSPADEKVTKTTPTSKSSSQETPKEETPRGTRTSKRNKKEASPTVTPQSAPSSKTKSNEKRPNGETRPTTESKSPPTTPSKTKGASKIDNQSGSPSIAPSAKRKRDITNREDEVSRSIEIDDERSSSPKARANPSKRPKLVKSEDAVSDTVEIDEERSSPPKTKASPNKKLKLNGPKKRAAANPDATFAVATTTTAERTTAQAHPRRTTRDPQPRKDLQSAAVAETNEADEEGFHFCAYMPIGDRVWKLDGMDGFPQDLGPIEEGVDWLDIAQPALQERISQYAAGSIEFNLMAVVRDPILACVKALAANVKALEATEAKLAAIAEDWKELLDERKDFSDAIVHGQDDGLGLHNVDIERADLTKRDEEALEKADDLSQLLDLRKEIVLQQSGLRRACEDEMYSTRSDASRAMARREDYKTYCEEVAGAH